eukprot:Skav214779  [mRNA]  locus=scaffold4471:224538:231132:- [translate_table: standard]
MSLAYPLLVTHSCDGLASHWVDEIPRLATQGVTRSLAASLRQRKPGGHIGIDPLSPALFVTPLAAMVHVPVQVLLNAEDGFNLEMSNDAGGAPTLTLSMSTKLKISVADLLQTLMASTPVRPASMVAENPIMPFKNSPSP